MGMLKLGGRGRRVGSAALIGHGVELEEMVAIIKRISADEANLGLLDVNAGLS